MKKRPLRAVFYRPTRSERIAQIAFYVLVLLIWLAVIVGGLAILAGCESRTFTATRPDGTVIQYRRVTLLGESASEGVEVIRDGDEFGVSVGPTGSQTDPGIALEAFGMGLELGRGSKN